MRTILHTLTASLVIITVLVFPSESQGGESNFAVVMGIAWSAAPWAIPAGVLSCIAYKKFFGRLDKIEEQTRKNGEGIAGNGKKLVALQEGMVALTSAQEQMKKDLGNRVDEVGNQVGNVYSSVGTLQADIGRLQDGQVSITALVKQVKDGVEEKIVLTAEQLSKIDGRLQGLEERHQASHTEQSRKLRELRTTGNGLTRRVVHLESLAKDTNQTVADTKRKVDDIWNFVQRCQENGTDSTTKQSSPPAHKPHTLLLGQGISPAYYAQYSKLECSQQAKQSVMHRFFPAITAGAE